MRRRHLQRAGLALAGVAMAGLLTSCELPTIHWVDSTADAPDATIGDGTCATAAGECSLRAAAIQEANASAGPVRIELGDAQTYTLSVAGIGENASATGDLDIAGQLTIEGHGSTIDAAGIDRVLELTGTAGLSLNDATLTGGYAELAGGIRINAGTNAQIARSTITANTAYGYTRCQSSYIPETDWCSSETSFYSQFLDLYRYRGEGGGAGIWNRGTLSIWDSTISANVIPEIPPGNVVAWPGSTPQSAECWQEGRAFICDIHMGAGLLNYATANLVNVTISGNSVGDGYGAAVANAPWIAPDLRTPVTPQTTMLFTTITGNTNVDPAVPAPVYAQIRGWPTSGSAIVGSPRVGSTVIDGVGPLCSTSLAATSLGSNTAADSSCFDPTIQATDRNNLASGLGPLAANGGPTLTHLPLAGSALIDSIPPCTELLPTDQRGSARSAGQPCTVGAVEP